MALQLEIWLSSKAPTLAAGPEIPRGLADRLAFASTLIKEAGDREQEAHLLYRDSAGAAQVIKIRARLNAGREDDNHVHLDDGRASKHHFSIFLVDGDFRLEDAGSRNGTYVNGRRVRTHYLCAGDVIEAGGSVLVFLDALRNEGQDGTIPA
jgi:pSer/pThr/pTyr-binding forkhead associated (FHA) protein